MYVLFWDLLACVCTACQRFLIQVIELKFKCSKSQVTKTNHRYGKKIVFERAVLFYFWESGRLMLIQNLLSGPFFRDFFMLDLFWLYFGSISARFWLDFILVRFHFSNSFTTRIYSSTDLRMKKSTIFRRFKKKFFFMYMLKSWLVEFAFIYISSDNLRALRIQLMIFILLFVIPLLFLYLFLLFCSINVLVTSTQGVPEKPRWMSL